MQRITPYEKSVAELTGEVGEKVGSPQLMIVDESEAILPGRTEEGALLLDDEYLRLHNIYPLQVKTVHFVAGLAKVGFGASLGLGSIALLIGFFRKCRTGAVAFG